MSSACDSPLRPATWRDWWRAGRSVLGINRRNLAYVFRGGDRERRLVDDKWATKARLAAAGLPAVPSFGVAAHMAEVPTLLDAGRRAGGVAIKPVSGSGGSGLMVLVPAGPDWRSPGGRSLDRRAVRLHVASILAGDCSGARARDRALFEPVLRDADDLAAVHGESGLSDIRIIVDHGRAVMAMWRLPCAASDGAANLHAGGLGVGVDLATGRTQGAMQHARPVAVHPDTGRDLSGIDLPHWARLIAIAEDLYRAFDLPYLGADLVVDRERGPLVLEVNARPGLAVQLANGTGLRSVLAEAPR